MAYDDLPEPAAPMMLGNAASEAARARAQAAARTTFAQVMFLVAVSLGFTAIGAYIGRDLSGGASIGFFIAGFVALIGLRWVRGTTPAAMALLFGVGLLLGLAIGPAVAAYANAPGGDTVVAQSAGATALFVSAFGAWGYATRRDLSSWYRALFWSLVGLLVLGLVFLFVSIPGEYVIWSILGLAVFAGFTIFDFNRLRRAHPDQSVWIAASIYLDILNVFLFMLQLIGGSRS
jgi:modulator of FtsH protease